MKNVLITKMRQSFFVLIVFSFQWTHAQDATDQTEDAPAEVDIIAAEIVADESRGVQTDTPNAETVIELEEIDNSQASSLVDLLDSIPNVSLTGVSTPQGSAVTIRGLGSQGSMYGADGAVAVVIDGVASGAEEVYRAGALFALEPELFRSLKVNRGPSGSFKYNSGVFGGTIETEVKDASDFLLDGDKFSFRQKFGYETNGSSKLTTSILSFAPNDKSDLLLFYSHRERSDYIDGTGNSSQATGFKMFAYGLKSNYYFNDSNKISFLHTKSQIPEKDKPYNTFDPEWGGILVDRDIGDETTNLQYTLNPTDNDLLDFNAKISFKREDMDISHAGTTTSTTSSLYNAGHNTTTLGLSLLNNALIDRELISHFLTFGLEIKKRERKSTVKAGTYEGDNDGSAPGGTDESFALFLTNEISIGEKLKVTPTVRVENQTLTSENNKAYIRWGSLMPAITDGTSYDSQAITGGLSTSYKLNESVTAFTSLYYNENLPILDRLREENIRQSDKATTREIGFSYNNTDLLLEKDELKAKINLFSTNIYDGTTYSSTDTVGLKGMEIELSYTNAIFYMDFNTGLTRGKINDSDEYFKYITADSLQLLFGKKFIDNQVNTFFDIKHTRPQNRVGTGESDADPSKSYTILKLISVYKPEQGFLNGYEFRFAAENLADVKYTPYQSERSSMGRNFKLSIAKTF